MSDGMGNFRWWYSGWRTPSRLLRQQKRAIKQAAEKLQSIDKQYSTKILKDDIQAESLIADLGETKIIDGVTVGGVISTEDGKIILVEDTHTWWWFPKGKQTIGETDEQTLRRVLLKKLWLQKDSFTLQQKVDEYEGYSLYHKEYRLYKWYMIKLIGNPPIGWWLDKDIIHTKKFDIENILTILESDHQQTLRKKIQSQREKIRWSSNSFDTL